MRHVVFAYVSLVIGGISVYAPRPRVQADLGAAVFGAAVLERDAFFVAAEKVGKRASPER